MNEDKIELDLNNPIFVYYLNTSNRPRQQVEQSIHHLNENFKRYINITVWIVVTEDSSRMECLYQGYVNKSTKELYDKIIDIYNSGNDFSDIKTKIRNLILEDIFENENEEQTC